MQARLASSPNTGITRWRTNLEIAGACGSRRCKLRNSACTAGTYRSSKPASWSGRYSAAPPSCHESCIRNWTRSHEARLQWRNPLERRRRRRYTTTVMHPTTAEMMASVQMARCGVRFRECKRSHGIRQFFVFPHGVGHARPGVDAGERGTDQRQKYRRRLHQHEDSAVARRRTGHPPP